ncbi:MAG: inositol monophosphatase [Betaproteobacteria bacterium]|nr:inositol monophosphatase [Betaproteobacteria bacterium]
MNTIPDLARLLETVICAATDAGALLVAERARVGGPRGGGETAPVDVEIERQLRKTLLAAWPARFVGEELGVVPCAADASQEQQRDCWVVDPQDGTRDFLRGLGGSSVSVALLREGRPVLGVVYAPMPPDRGPDLIAWAEGTGPIRRNGLVIGSREPPLARQQLTSTQRVLMSRSAEHRPEAIAALITPAQCMTMTSIAYRLALVAAGDAVATLTLHGVQSWDIAAGHALLIGAGGELYDDDGLPVRYGAEGAAEVRACFGGAPAAALELASRKSAWVKANGP